MPSHDDPPVKPAATIMVVRDGPARGAPSRGDRARDEDGAVLEVLMLRRNLASEFVSGAYVFPGGAVDPEDADAAAAGLCEGRTDEDASTVLGISSGGLSYWVAALRECFEEAGILVAFEAGSDRVLRLDTPDIQERFIRHRSAVNGGTRGFLDVCREEGLRLAVDRVHYFSHWITPKGAPRRYDTRFFVSAAPPAQTPLHDAGETIADRWIRPADALDQHRAGRIELILPTIRTLQAIGRFARTDDLLAAVSAIDRQVPTMEPRLVADGRGIRLLLPGDPGFDESDGSAMGEAGGRVPVGDASSFRDAVRAVSRSANPGPPRDLDLGPSSEPGTQDDPAAGEPGG